VFEKRLRPSSEYGPFIVGEFKPYIPSENIIRKFAEKAEEFRRSNPTYEDPFEAAMPVIMEMIDKMQGADLSKEFKIKLSDFGIEEQEAPTENKGNFDPFKVSELPQPNPGIVQSTAQATPNVMQTGLTPTESALLSEEEKMIALRNRGLA